jgi:hypothetical protein
VYQPLRRSCERQIGEGVQTRNGRIRGKRREHPFDQLPAAVDVPRLIPGVDLIQRRKENRVQQYGVKHEQSYDNESAVRGSSLLVSDPSHGRVPCVLLNAGHKHLSRFVITRRQRGAQFPLEWVSARRKSKATLGFASQKHGRIEGSLSVHEFWCFGAFCPVAT